MDMKVSTTPLEGVLIIEPKVFADHRGFFLETYNEQRYRENGLAVRFVQDNHSKSQRGILRGLHYQIKKPQAKLVWVVAGEIWDVAVDIRRGSPTYGQWFGMTLDALSKKQLYVPAGFAHGFAVTSETAEVYYKCTDFYDPADEGGVIWNDPDLAIRWPIDQPTLSGKDAALPQLKNAKTLATNQ
jgi:dTDP-4-dehydrorhamnose 3,5-epimerase